MHSLQCDTTWQICMNTVKNTKKYINICLLHSKNSLLGHFTKPYPLFELGMPFFLCRLCLCVLRNVKYKKVCVYSIWPAASSSLSWSEVKQGDKRSVLVATFSCHSQYPSHTLTTHTYLHTHWEPLSYFSRTMLCLIRVVMWTKAAVLSATADLWALKFRQETS